MDLKVCLKFSFFFSTSFQIILLELHFFKENYFAIKLLFTKHFIIFNFFHLLFVNKLILMDFQTFQLFFSIFKYLFLFQKIPKFQNLNYFFKLSFYPFYSVFYFIIFSIYFIFRFKNSFIKLLISHYAYSHFYLFFFYLFLFFYYINYGEDFILFLIFNFITIFNLLFYKIFLMIFNQVFY